MMGNCTVDAQHAEWVQGDVNFLPRQDSGILSRTRCAMDGTILVTMVTNEFTIKGL